jgi:hypothetical protein
MRMTNGTVCPSSICEHAPRWLRDDLLRPQRWIHGPAGPLMTGIDDYLHADSTVYVRLG